MIEKKTTNKNYGGRYNCLKHVAPLVLNTIMTTMPAHASGKVFDFNATLPAMALQFLLLMVFLDKTWFGPVGKILDERDASIQARLSSVKTGDEELEALAKEAETLLKAARSDAQNKIADSKNKAASKASEELAAEKKKLDAELATSMKQLEVERKESEKDVDKQVSELSAFIVRKVLPTGFSI